MWNEIFGPRNLWSEIFGQALISANAGYSGVREPFKRLLCQGMVCLEAYYREGEHGKKTYFYPDEIDVEVDAKGKAVAARAKSDGLPVTIGRVEKMSKSKRNTVDPQQLIDRFGADTARMFVLFAAPPELDLESDDAGVMGRHRFLKRLWQLAQDQRARLAGTAPYADPAKAVAGADQQVVRKVHATVKRATDAMERDFGFNTAIATCMELMNELKPDQLTPAVLKLGLTTLVRLLAPMTPVVERPGHG